MFFNLSYKKEDPRSIVSFLNSPAVDFYSGKMSFADPNYAMTVKSCLLSALNHVEGTITGTFNCDLFLRGISNKSNPKLNAMFPVGCQVFRDIDLGETLCCLRDMNAHARVSERDIEILNDKTVFEKLGSVKKLNLSVSYLTKESLVTMGGLIVSIMLFMKRVSIAELCKRSAVFRCLGSRSSESSRTYGQLFVKTISNADLELPIRIKRGNSLCSALFGEYENKLVRMEDGSLTLLFGLPKFPTYILMCDIDESKQTVKVSKNSLTKVFYEKDYLLQINDLNGFIEIANALPPFVIVDLLYRKGITVFDNAAYESIANKMDSYSKLNQPKFYADKNLDILLLPSTKSDFRVVSSHLSEAIAGIFLRFEEKTYEKNDIEQKGFSKIKDALAINSFSEELTTRLIVLRNFAMHGYILDESKIYDGKAFKYSLEFIVNGLREMLLELQEHNESLFGFVQKDIYENLVRKMLVYKYQSIIEYTMDAFGGHKRFDPSLPEVQNKQLYVQSSIFNTSDLNPLFVKREPSPIISKIVIEGEPEPYFIYTNNAQQEKALTRFLADKEDTYSIERVVPDGIIETVYWKKES